MPDDFLNAVTLWSTVKPYSGFPSETIAWRLIPAFKHNSYKMWHNADGSCRGFVTWAFMSSEEFDTREYSGAEIFARKSGDKLVFVDMIAPNGVSDVLYMSRDLRSFFRKQFPEVKIAWSHRGPRTGWYPKKAAGHD
jgi:hemolysin-activating ACP:hemolysin acyltransferase